MKINLLNRFGDQNRTFQLTFVNFFASFQLVVLPAFL